jgi:D-alanyl-D-alanine carboxypeptidase/D-alanyl-D-alanine-endopeptidase (penicillin-binding protein 4)
MNKRLCCVLGLLVAVLQMYGQTVADKLKKATTVFLNDEQLKHAIVSVYVTDTEGNEVFSLNREYGLAPASTQKIFTSAAALSILGGKFNYETQIGYTGTIEKGQLKWGSHN